jgi:hypothetical protein
MYLSERLWVLENWEIDASVQMCVYKYVRN